MGNYHFGGLGQVYLDGLSELSKCQSRSKDGAIFRCAGISCFQVVILFFFFRFSVYKVSVVSTVSAVPAVYEVSAESIQSMRIA